MRAIQRWHELEDWVEFYSTRELACVGRGKYAAVMNFGGPGGAVPYHFYARVRRGHERLITRVTVAEETFAPVNKVRPVKGTPAEFRWVHLGSVKMRRNYRRVTLTAPRGLAGLDRLCVLEIPRRLTTGEIERRIARDGHPPEPLSGVPLGGVGAGKLELCRDGLFRNITLNGNIDTPLARSDGAFFAVRAVQAGRALGRVVAAERLHGLTPMAQIEFAGVYPYAVLRARDRAFPLRVEIRATGTIIPRNIKDSALPAALFRVRVAACGDDPVQATVVFCMENFLGCGGAVAPLANRRVFDEGFYELWAERAGNHERAWQQGRAAGLLFDGGRKLEKRSQGQYVLATDARVAGRLTGWRFEQEDEVWGRFVDTGLFPSVAGRVSRGERTAGAVAVTVDLAAGEAREIPFVLAWHVPHFRQTSSPDYGHYYARHFQTAAQVARYCLKNFRRLETQAAEVPRLLDNSTLPPWLARSLANDAYTFSTCTWLTKDGRFAVNEGPTHMFGCMGTLDQKLYANHYYTLFFPDLDRTELLDFARSQGADGGIQHDLGYGHLEQKGKGHHWPDLSSALVILSLKHYQMTGDQAYLDEVYPHLARALLEYQLGLDTDGDGIANISGVGNTFDAEQYEGTSSYIASLWLAALKALENLAERRGDAQVAGRCRACFAKARANAIQQLWNGRFFVNYYDSKKQAQCPNSHISQVAGEFFSKLCGLGSLYGDAYVRQAVNSMLALNYHPRLVFPTNEATPDGHMASRFLWGWLPHARVYLGGTGCYFGLAEEGLAALARMEKVVADLNHDNRWDQRLFYEPDTGKEHWGRFYMTAPATWYVYQALLGYRWDQPQGTLALLPNLPPTMLPFAGPLFLPGFWAWLTVSRDRALLTLRIIKVFDRPLAIQKLVLAEQAGPVVVKADGRIVPLRRLAAGPNDREVECDCRINLAKVTKLTITGVFQPPVPRRSGFSGRVRSGSPAAITGAKRHGRASAQAPLWRQVDVLGKH